MRVPDLFDLTGRRALVSGGGRGIGRHIALGLAEAGAHVIVASRKLDHCREVVAQIEAAGGSASAHRADVSEPESIDELLATVFTADSGLDILVNNAARTWAAPVFDYPLDAWDRVFDLNVRGLFYLSQAVARRMRDGAGGSIINVGSLNAFRGAREEKEPTVGYAASKGAVTALTLDMAVKLAPHGIRVNAIAPGAFMTDMLNPLKEQPERLAELTQRIPQRRIGQEDDVKGAAVFLASDASSYVTGHTLAVDGGLMAATPFI